MPRKRKTQSGADAQGTPDSVPGVRYGEGVEHQQLATVLPAADMRAGAPTPGAPGSMPSAPPRGGTGAPLDPAVLGQLMQGAPIGGLRSTARPDEPVTAGIPTGPGPGPSMSARKMSPLARTMQELYNATGDRTFLDLARKAGLR